MLLVKGRQYTLALCIDLQVCRQEMPHFGSDMWSTMCVLVEMLTGQKPWEHGANGCNPSGLIFMVSGSGQTSSCMTNLTFLNLSFS